MNVAKEFTWDAAHRLPWHEGKCASIHGHRYRMMVELEGQPNKHGMVVDFGDIKKVVGTLVADWDHATIVAATDKVLKRFLEEEGQKYFVLPGDTTSENIAQYVCRWIRNNPIYGAKAVRVTVWETTTCYASAYLDLSA